MPIERGSSRLLREARRIVFLRTDRIGDVLMNLPALHVLRQNYPKAWISFCVDEKIASLFKGHPDIDEIIAIDAEQFKRSFGYRWRMVREFRKARFDIGVVSNPDKWLHFLVYFSGISCRVGYKRKWGLLLNRSMAVSPQSQISHEIDKNLELAMLVCDDTWDQRILLPIDDRARDRMGALFAENKSASTRKLAAIHAGTSHPGKRWRLERFAELCCRIQSEWDLDIVLIGGQEEVELSRELRSKISGSVWDLTGVTTLPELVALFNRPEIQFLVSTDSGPAHIAWICQKPVVSLYAKNVPGSDPQRWGPRDAKSQVIFDLMDNVSVEQVMAAVKRLLKKTA